MNRLYRPCSKGIELGTEQSLLSLSAPQKTKVLGSICQFPSNIAAPVQIGLFRAAFPNRAHLVGGWGRRTASLIGKVSTAPPWHHLGTQLPARPKNCSRPAIKAPGRILRVMLLGVRVCCSGTELCIAALFKVPSPMEDLMCWEMDYKFFAEQKKAQESRIRGEQRSGVIHQLLNEANKQGESTNVEGTQVKEVAPAK